MVQTRLITGAILVAVLSAVVSLHGSRREDEDPGDESESWQRFSERCAGDSLKTIAAAEDDLPENDRAPASLADLAAAEADFRGCDRDGHRVEDFWNADVSSFYLATPVEKGPDPCDSAAETCASSILARSEEGWISPPPPRAAGTYRVTSTGVLMPGTEGALRVIEFTADRASGQEEP